MAGSRGSIFVFALAVTAAFIFLLLAMRPAADAGTVPTGFTEELVDTGLSAPTTMAKPFVDLTSVVGSAGERGLLGIAFQTLP